MCEVSFIIGTYNGSLKLHKLFDSILNQSFKNYEIIVCDDNSNDDTLDILNEYKNKYPNIFKILINEKPLTLAGSLNRCLSVACGKYIARIDDDDICYEDRLEKQISFLKNNKNIDCVGSFIDIFDGNKVTAKRKIVLNPNINTLLKGGYPFHHPTIIIKKEVLRKLNGYDSSERCKRCEDLDLWYRFFISGYKGYNMDESLIKYHETIEDYKKRNFKNTLISFNLRRYYRKLLKKSVIYDVFYLKTLIVALLPNKVRYIIKKKREY